jgi:hypothetical protein
MAELKANKTLEIWGFARQHLMASGSRDSTAFHFLDKLESKMPFNIRAIQVYGGSEFKAVFEEECHRRDIRLFVLPNHGRPSLMDLWSERIGPTLRNSMK